LLEIQKSERPYLGVILVEMGKISKEKLLDLLDEFNKRDDS